MERLHEGHLGVHTSLDSPFPFTCFPSHSLLLFSSPLAPNSFLALHLFCLFRIFSLYPSSFSSSSLFLLFMSPPFLSISLFFFLSLSLSVYFRLLLFFPFSTHLPSLSSSLHSFPLSSSLPHFPLLISLFCVSLYVYRICS